MASVPLEQEINPWETQEARFDFAARKLNLEDGLWKLLRTQAPRGDRAFSSDDG